MIGRVIVTATAIVIASVAVTEKTRSNIDRNNDGNNLSGSPGFSKGFIEHQHSRRESSYRLEYRCVHFRPLMTSVANTCRLLGLVSGKTAHGLVRFVEQVEADWLGSVVLVG